MHACSIILNYCTAEKEVKRRVMTEDPKQQQVQQPIQQQTAPISGMNRHGEIDSIYDEYEMYRMDDDGMTNQFYIHRDKVEEN
jgi:hypothetical protein